jgi:hypothetical protein
MSHVGQPSDDVVGTGTGGADVAGVEALRAANGVFNGPSWPPMSRRWIG